ncbi:MAG: ArnT family glycosyltransferase [Victivallales bacterium]
MFSERKNTALLCFAITFVLLSLGTIGTDVTKIDIRFALMVQDMALHGLGMFPTLNGVEYGDYPSGWVFCSWLATFGGSQVSLWLLSLPAILLGAYTMAMVYLTGELSGKNTGLAAVMFLLVTPEFLKLFAGFGIDVPVMAAGVTMLYLFRKKESVLISGGVFAVLLACCFLFRGPMGVVLLGAGTGGYLLACREWKNVLFFGAAGAVTAVLCGIFWYCGVQQQGGQDLWEWFLRCQLYSRMGKSEYGAYFTGGLFSFAPVTLLAFGIFLLPRRRVLSGPVAGWLGYVFLPILILSIPACKHLRYLALTLPGFALLASEAWSGNIPRRFTDRWLPRVMKLLQYFTAPLLLAAICILAAVGCFLSEPALVPWGHFACAVFLIVVCGFLKCREIEKFRPAIVTGIFLTVALIPFLALPENSGHFISQVERDLAGQIYLYEMGPDHDDLKYVFGVPPEKRSRIHYLYAEKRTGQGYYDRMYPSECISGRMEKITGNDILILRDRKRELELLQAEAEKHHRKMQIKYSGMLGHRKFVAVCLTPQEK